MGILDRLNRSPRARFAAEALRIARHAPGVASARYDRRKFAIAVWRPGESDPLWVYLRGTYGDCEGASLEERRERIERLMPITVKAPAGDPWESVRSKVRPVLRPVMFGQADVTRLAPPISRPAMPHVRQLLVVDRPESMTYVVPQHLNGWGVKVDDVFRAASGNLERLATESLQRRWPTDTSMVRMVDTGDGFYPSLLLAPGWLAGVCERRGVRTIAFVPDTNTVMLCDLPAYGMGRLYEMVERQYVGAARRLSPVGYVAGDRGEVVPYAPPADHPDHLAARRAEALLAVNEYGAQTQWLTREFEQAGIDVSVGRLWAAAPPDTPAITVATWVDGITSLLPRAEFISFVRDGVHGPLVAWQTAAELVDLRPEPLLTPVRYRVGGWPAPEVMDALRARAVN
jgi:hypothetical protein